MRVSSLAINPDQHVCLEEAPIFSEPESRDAVCTFLSGVVVNPRDRDV
jgi:hypothetical protein